MRNHAGTWVILLAFSLWTRYMGDLASLYAVDTLQLPQQ